MSRWAIYLAFGLLSIALYLAPGPLQHADAVIGLLGAVTVVATLLVVILGRPVARFAWGLMAAALLLIFTGDLMPQGPGFGLDDVFYFAFYPPMLAGVVLLVRHRTRSARAGALIDGLILTLGLALPSWIVLIAPSLHEGDLTFVDAIVRVGFPVGDLLLLGGIVQLALDGGRRGPAFHLLVGSVSGLLLSDFATGLMTASGQTAADDPLVLVAWMVSFVLWGTAVLHPSMRTLAELAPARREVLLTRTRLILLTCASLVAPVLSLTHDLREGDWDYAVVQAVSLALFALVIARMTGLARRERTLSAQLHRRHGEDRFAALIRNTRDLLLVVNPGGGVSYASPSVARILGTELTASFLIPEDRTRVRAALAASAQGEDVAPFECTLVDLRGDQRVFEVHLTNLTEEQHVGGILLNARDVTERRAFEAQLTHQAFHDPVTGLANRELFVRRVRQAISQARRSGHTLAVLFLDLDDFKLVNDSLGHATGDEILVEVGRRLDGGVRGVDTAARFGGDEFALLLEDVDSHAAAEAARRILDLLATPIRTGGRELTLRASLGVSVAQGADPRDAEDLLRDADAAMYHAKRDGHGGYRLFEPAMHADVLARLELRTDLQRAIDAGELELHYQPVVRLVDGATTGFEALMRWRHPERGLISPADFIPIAEETGLIVPMGRWALLEATSHLRALGSLYRMNVNLSAKQLQDPELVYDVRAAIEGIDPRRLTLELTESIVMEDTGHAVAQLTALKALGVRLALDDFGTGYSSLGYLSRLPVDVLKLDRTFLACDEPNLIAAVVGLGQALALDVVAEGIEEEEQWRTLRELGCHYGQGFLFSKPLSAADSLAAVH
ncbi:PAS domain S-box-containing protein/diguanylate cyclase (GGDEF)-like protein [Solirubrobacter pauli]|uniref:PAS domain S-box-containing protein/diguanylate cyclase (GGDEF)-like protein n=1 Tax=Solirubrobacter pauli TaxID=166793 RepID=A0A660LCJ2_9ACTN|nr:EAL domain-containing protein [Solirubrobacter pauli]RKQ92289.1 PAS domain S-box-containing protein/diguanylate cyclase (GGDEF)-like protein [Solirubrobacter pauli]